jgi:hypothetical protein
MRGYLVVARHQGPAGTIRGQVLTLIGPWTVITHVLIEEHAGIGVVPVSQKHDSLVVDGVLRIVNDKGAEKSIGVLSGKTC